MSYNRYSLYGSEEMDEFGGVDDMDMSGFLGKEPHNEVPQAAPESNPSRPKVTARPRGGGGASSSPYPPNVGYTIRNPVHQEPDEDPGYYAFSPFYAHDDALGGKAVAWTKLAGATGMVITGAGMAFTKLQSPVANKAFIASTAVYLHPTLGWNHGLIKVIKGDNLVTRIGAGAAKIGIHGTGAVIFYKLLRR